MTQAITLYHNPRCSKSRAALELLKARGAELNLVEYLDSPPSEGELRELATALGGSPHSLLRDNEPEYAALKLSEQSGLTEIIQALSAHPRLLQRPIAKRGGRALIGRPPERVLELLSD